MVINAVRQIPGLASTDIEIRTAAVSATIPCITASFRGPAQPSRASGAAHGQPGESSRCSTARGAGNDRRCPRAVTEAGGFADRYRAAVAARGATLRRHRPHPELLEQWGCRCRRRSVAQFSDICVEALGPRRRHRRSPGGLLRGVRLAGYRGPRARHRRLCGDAGALVVADAKRGDIGSHDGRLRPCLAGRALAIALRRGDSVASQGSAHWHRRSTGAEGRPCGDRACTHEQSGEPRGATRRRRKDPAQSLSGHRRRAAA